MRIVFRTDQYSQQRQREKKRWIYPVRMAMEAQYYRNKGYEVLWNPSSIEPEDFVVDSLTLPVPFSELPAPDRIFSGAFDPRYQNNGNFKYRPGTYIMSASGCSHGRCTFCVENGVKWQVRSAGDVAEEVEECMKLGFREIFDDSATFPTYEPNEDDWIVHFCEELIWRNIKVPIGCNMRLIDTEYGLMKQVGFRMLLFGLESANQNTLDLINKGTKVEDVKYIIKAAKAGIEPHVAVMFGFPWETDQDAINTLRLVHWLLRKGYAKTAQASFYTPPDGVSNEHHRKYVKRLYHVAAYPDFWLNKLRDIHNVDDLKYLWRQIKEGLGLNR